MKAMKFLFWIVVIFLFSVNIADAADWTGIWGGASGGSEYSISQNGQQINGVLTNPSANSAATLGWIAGDQSFYGTLNGQTMTGKIYGRFPVSYQKSCPDQAFGTNDVTMTMSSPFSSIALAATGVAVSGMASYDQIIPALMSRWGLPGASVAVMKDGKLVFARGYGLANTATGATVLPQTKFRIASVTKPITATIIMKLVEQGLLTLDTPAFSLLNLGLPVDTRVNQITIRQLLEHSGGWDRDISGDPMFNVVAIAGSMGVQSPPDTATIIQYMLSRPLDFNPGTRYAYSNFGYCVLGRVIEKITGQRYEDYAKSVLSSIGISSMKLGHSLPVERVADEAAYYDAPGTSLTDSVFDLAPGKVHWPDGGFAIEAMDSHGGWLASAADLVMFAAAMDGMSSRPDLLSTSSLAEMVKRPAYTSPADSSWYGKGWQVNQYGNYWHNGSLPGTASLLVVTAGGVQWAFLANMRSETNDPALALDIDNSLWDAYNRVTAWPSKSSQIISFGIAPSIVVGGTGAVSATATSGLAVSFSSTTPSVCTVLGSTVTGIAAGTCTIVADQAGDTSYSEATQATQNITIGISLSDCIFNWVETNFAQYFSPAGAPSVPYPPYYYRYYSGTGNFLVTSSPDNTLYVYGPVTGNTALKVGLVTDFLGVAGCP